MRCHHLVLLLPLLAAGSENGGYYTCSFPNGPSECIFALSSSAPSSWLALGNKEHDITNSPCSFKAKGPVCQVQDMTGKDLRLSVKPWQHGDNIGVTDTTQTGDDLTYSYIFELIAPLRNLMMYHPAEATPETWATLTKAFTDCKVKAEDEEGDHGTAYSVDSVYDIMMDPQGEDVHHYILQFLEEGAIDLVCLATDLEFDHCDTIRAKWGVERGQKCDCWVGAYQELFGVGPKLDTDLGTCEA